jgi:parallel beta-helix repeat protein
MKHNLLLLLVFLAVVSAWGVYSPSTHAAGNTYYVATSGSNSHSCSQAQNRATPKRTIKEGMACMSGGETLMIKGGTYAECLTTSDFKSGTAQARTVIKRHGTDQVTLKPHAGQCHHVILIHGERKYVTLDGINIDGSNMRGNNMKFEPVSRKRDSPYAHRSEDYFLEQASFIHVLNAKLSHAGNCGIQGRANNSLFRNLEIYGTRTHCYGYYFNGHGTIIENNNIHHNANGGMQIYAQGGDETITKQMHIRNNWVHDNCTHMQTGCIGGILLANGLDNYIYNNIVVNNGKTGIRLYSATRSIRIYNNTIVNHNIGIHLHNKIGHIVRNNILYQNRTPMAGTNSSMTISNNLTTNPSFANASGGGYHLQSGSPAIDKGMTLSEVPCDANGNKRPAGSAYDIGAYEYGASPSSNCPQREGITLAPSPTP